MTYFNEILKVRKFQPDILTQNRVIAKKPAGGPYGPPPAAIRVKTTIEVAFYEPPQHVYRE